MMLSTAVEDDYFEKKDGLEEQLEELDEIQESVMYQKE
jgi:hypothetical protein